MFSYWPESANKVLISLSKPDVGAYWIGEHYCIKLRTKPNFIHRFFMKHLLGKIWKDE